MRTKYAVNRLQKTKNEIAQSPHGCNTDDAVVDGELAFPGIAHGFPGTVQHFPVTPA